MSQRRVLIVDDALFMRNTLRDIFTTAGFAVAARLTTASRPSTSSASSSPTGHDGHRDAVQVRIDATREIVQQDPGAVVIMCSALGQESLVMEAIEAGATDFIVKPFRGEDVLAVVKKVLGE